MINGHRRRKQGHATRDVVLLALAIAALPIAGAVWGSRTLLPGASADGLQVVAADLDLGEVWASNNHQRTVTLHNPTDRVLSVLDVQTSCGCTTVEPRSLQLAPGSSAPLRLTIDLTPASLAAVQPSRPFSVQVAAIVEGGLVQQKGWQLVGKVMDPFAFAIHSVDIADDIVAGSPYSVPPIKFRPLHDFDHLDAECNYPSGGVEVRVEGSLAEPELRVNLGPSIAPGPFRLDVVVSAYRKGARCANAVVPVQGLVVNDIESVPSAVTFGGAEMNGTAEEQTVVLRSRSQSEFSVDSVEGIPSSNELVIEPVSVGAPKPNELLYRIRLLPTRAGSQVHKVAFAIRTSAGRIVIPLEISYFGIAPSTPSR